jgi:hypothetical protein
MMGSGYQTHSFPSRVPKGTGRFLMRRPAVLLIENISKKKKNIEIGKPYEWMTWVPQNLKLF